VAETIVPPKRDCLQLPENRPLKCQKLSGGHDGAKQRRLRACLETEARTSWSIVVVNVCTKHKGRYIRRMQSLHRS